MVTSLFMKGSYQFSCKDVENGRPEKHLDGFVSLDLLICSFMHETQDAKFIIFDAINKGNQIDSRGNIWRQLPTTNAD